MINMKRIIFLFVIFFLCFNSFAQKSWTFQQCLDTALKRNISVNQSRLSNELNKISLAQSKANWLPNLSASASEGINFGKSVNPQNSLVGYTYNSTKLNMNSGLDLFNGLQNSRTIEQNTMAIEAGKYDISNVENTVTLNITTAYLQVLFAYELVAAAENQIASTTSQVDQTEKLVNAGKVPESNLFQIRSQYATDKLTLVNAQSTLDLAKVTLLQLMEVPVLDSFEIEKPVITEPSVPILQTKQDIYLKALTVQPQIAGASVRTNIALLGIKISEGARWPSLSLNGNISTNFAGSSKKSSDSGANPDKQRFFNQLWENLGEGLGLSLSIPIYSNRLIKSSIETAKVNALNVKLNEQNIQNQLRKSVEQTYTDLKNAMKKYDATKEQFSSAEVSYKNMETKFKVGMVTAIDFLVEKNNYIQAQSNLIQSKYDYLFKTKILDFYQGKAIRF